MTEIKKVRYTWIEFDEDSRAIARRVKAADLKISKIYGVPRGGLILAVRLSHLLNLPLSFNTEDFITNHVLTVDEIVDTGKTMRVLEPISELFASIHCCSSLPSNFRPDIYIKEKDPNEWIVYPWEVK